MLLQPGSRPVPNCPDYILIRKRGAGAFGEVWHARGPGGLDMALKFIRLDAPMRFLELRSLDAIKDIRHPNLVSVFGAWSAEDWLILAMELCDRSLQDRLNEALAQDLPGIPLDELLGYMSDAANGLDALNARQVQHRDVKPANLLLQGSGVKVADFGLAKALEQTVASNSGAGTLAYTAPECFKGQLTQQSDQYSLAVTYYHLRTGRLLFKGDQAKVMYSHLEVEPELSRLPRAERKALMRPLSKEPSKRWENCIEFVKELIAAVCDPGDALRYQKRGIARMNQKDYNKAIKYFNEAIRIDPKLASTYGLRGLAWLRKDDYCKAIRDFDKASLIDPKRAPNYLLRGFAWLRQGDYDKAIRDFDESIRLHPNDSRTYCFRGEAWEYKGNYDKAFLDSNEAIRINPKHSNAYFSRGVAWHRKGEYDNAIKDFDEAIRLDPDIAKTYFARGAAWVSKEEYDKAIRDFDEAIRIDPNNTLAHEWRALAWKRREGP